MRWKLLVRSKIDSLCWILSFTLLWSFSSSDRSSSLTAPPFTSFTSSRFWAPLTVSQLFITYSTSASSCWTEEERISNHNSPDCYSRRSHYSPPSQVVLIVPVILTITVDAEVPAVQDQYHWNLYTTNRLNSPKVSNSQNSPRSPNSPLIQSPRFLQVQAVLVTATVLTVLVVWKSHWSP